MARSRCGGSAVMISSRFLWPRRVECGLQTLARHLPVVRELSGAGDPFPAVHRHAVAGLVGAQIREQERREIGDLFGPAEAAQGNPLDGVLLRLLASEQA